MNTPYVKNYNEKGILTNPIQISYMSFYPNRKTRRNALHGKHRFTKNTKSKSNLTILHDGKFKRVLQNIVLKFDNVRHKPVSVKKIYQYISNSKTEKK